MELPQQTWVDSVFTTVTRNRQLVINGFKALYLVLVTVLFFGGWAIHQGGEAAIFWYRLAPMTGQAGLVVYILTTIPGIARRFRIQHKLIALLMIFRRYVGITMYLLVTIHYFFLRGIASWFGHILRVIPEDLFQLMGFMAYVLTFFLFATSNDFSTKHLGIWWDKIHRLTYIIIWFIFLHVALQRFSIWSILIGITAVLQVASHIASFIRKTRAGSSMV